MAEPKAFHIKQESADLRQSKSGPGLESWFRVRIRIRTPDLDDLQNVTKTSLSHDAFVIKFVRRYDQFFYRNMNQIVVKCHISHS